MEIGTVLLIPTPFGYMTSPEPLLLDLITSSFLIFFLRGVGIKCIGA